jgi:predicted nucleotidyltransferase
MVIDEFDKIPEPIQINTTTIAILKLFLSNPTKEYTISELSRITQINYRLIYEQVMRYEKDGTLSIKKVGQSKLCKINLSRNIGLYSFIESIRAMESVKKNPQLKVIRNALVHTSTKFYTMVLFGSYAKGAQTKNSDIDLLFIVPHSEKTDKIKNEIEKNLELLSYKIDINVINEADFVNLKNETGINIRNQVTDNHIILYGAENYYRTIA